jgi:hypothetical protein
LRRPAVAVAHTMVERVVVVNWVALWRIDSWWWLSSLMRCFSVELCYTLLEESANKKDYHCAKNWDFTCYCCSIIPFSLM